MRKSSTDPDREVLAAFLAGATSAGPGMHLISSSDTLYFCVSPVARRFRPVDDGGPLLYWFDTTQPFVGRWLADVVPRLFASDAQLVYSRALPSGRAQALAWFELRRQVNASIRALVLSGWRPLTSLPEYGARRVRSWRTRLSLRASRPPQTIRVGDFPEREGVAARHATRYLPGSRARPFPSVGTELWLSPAGVEFLKMGLKLASAQSLTLRNALMLLGAPGPKAGA